MSEHCRDYSIRLHFVAACLRKVKGVDIVQHVQSIENLIANNETNSRHSEFLPFNLLSEV